jgi:hypothetical protein
VTVAEPETKAPRPPRSAEPVAHLVLKSEWPIAVCGATVTERFGAGAPAMDRCPDCLRIARERGLGRPGWVS